MRGRNSAGGDRGSLDLAVGDLGDGSTSRGLNLTVVDLGYDGAGRGRGSRRGRSLNLAVVDLGDSWARWSGSHGRRSLDLAIANLSDGSTRWCLDLTVADLGHGHRDHGRDDLRLAIRQLGDDGSGNHGGTDDRAAWSAGTSTAGHDEDGNLLALRRPVTIVEVVEVAGQAAVPVLARTKSKSTVTADGETARVDGTGLGGAVELELVVVGNVTSAVLSIPKVAALESDD